MFNQSDYVIKYNNLPPSSPLNFTLLSILLLDYYEAPGYAWGIVLTLICIVWMAYISRLCTVKPVDIKSFIKTPVKPGNKKSFGSQVEDKFNQQLRNQNRHN